VLLGGNAFLVLKHTAAVISRLAQPNLQN